MSGKKQIRIIAYEFVSVLTILLELLLESNNTNKEILIFAGLFVWGKSFLLHGIKRKMHYCF